MAGGQAAWGIDLGRCALKAIKLRAVADGKVEVVAHDFIEHAKILSQPDADRHELIGSALEKFLSHNDISKDQVLVSVPGQHTLARFTKLPPVAPKRIPDIVRYEADQQIPFDMDEVIWDYQIFKQEDLPDIEVGIFAMKRELIREHLLHFEQAAIEPVGVQSGPLAVYNAALFDGHLSKETTILLDIGAESTDLVIATPSRLWTRTVPIGGNNFTEALVRSFKLAFSKAENLKRTAASSKYARQVFQAMRPVFADIVQELQRSIGFYSSTHRDAKVEKVVCVGNAFKLPGLQKYLQQNLSLPVEVPTAFRQVASSEAASAAALVEQVSGFWGAYGLALQGLGLTKVTSNLLPTEIAKQVVWRKKRPAFAAAAACLVLSGGIIWFRQSADMSALAASSVGADAVAKLSEQDAGEIIEDGPADSLSDRAKASTVLAAGNLMKEGLRKLQGESDKERKETEQLIAFQQNKRLIPKVLQVIHESIPRPDGPLSQAQTPAQIREAIATIPRGDRKVAFIDSLEMQYEADLRLQGWEPSLVDVEPALNDLESDKDLPGLLVKIACTTPNQVGINYIADAFADPLRRNGRRPDLGFYFDRVHVISGHRYEPERGQRGTSASRPSAPTAQPRPASGGRGLPGGPSPKGQPGGSIASRPGGAPTLDVLTDEPIDQDWQFEIWVEVILGEMPDADAEEAPVKGTKGKGGG